MSALFIGIGALALYELRQVQLRGEHIVDNDVAILEKIDDLATVQAKIETSIRNYMLVNDRELRKSLKAEMTELKAHQEALIAEAEVIAYGAAPAMPETSSEGDAAVSETASARVSKDVAMAEFLTSYQELKAASERINKKVMNVLVFGSSDMAATILVNEAAKVDKSMEEIVNKITVEKDTAMHDAVAEGEAIYNQAFMMMSAMVAAAVAIGAIAAWSIIVPLNRGFKLAIGLSQDVANSDLSKTVIHKEKGELADLLDNLNLMVGNLRGVVSNVSEGARYVSTGASQMAEASVGIADGGSKQAGATEDVSASVEQMTANIGQTAENAQETEKVALDSAEEARNSGAAVKEAMESLN
ncbi:MAG: hypothetical protein OIF55_08015, partial [Amphritea sp.]|nr:hypothetical protein [Amphritea sp.]